MYAHYRPDIDGLRALAVVPVVLFHAGLGFEGGFVGVDIFFVISGYLITLGLLKDNERGTFSIAEFYVRRIRRIVPALAAVVLATVAAASFLLLPSELIALGKSVVSAALFYSNIHFWSVLNYFDGGAITHPLLHSWSLSVEEQFYIVWPVAIWALYRLGLSRWLVWLMLVALVVTLVATELMLGYSPRTAFYLSPLRSWELLMGAVLATGRVPAIKASVARHALSILAIGMIAGSVFLLTEADRFPGLLALPSCLGAAILIHLGGPDQAIGNRLIAARPLVWIGLISYSLYLWHWPILSLYTIDKGSPISGVEGVALVGLSVFFGWLSWRYVERPFRKGPAARHVGGTAGTGKVLWAGSICLILLAGAGAALTIAKGFPTRVDRQTLAIDSYRPSPVKIDNGCLIEGDLPEDLANACFAGQAETQATVAIWGDSFARQYATELGRQYRSTNVEPVMLMATGCSPLPGAIPAFGHGRSDLRCRDFNDFILRRLLAMPQLQSVIIAGRWSNLYGLDFPGADIIATSRFLYAEDRTTRSLDNSLFQMERSLDRTLDALRAKGVAVTILREPPRYPGSFKRCAARASWEGRDIQDQCGSDLAQQRRFRAPVEGVLARVEARHPWVYVYDPLPFLCDTGPSGQCRGLIEGTLITEDSDHLSFAGSQRALREFELPLPRAASNAAMTP